MPAAESAGWFVSHQVARLRNVSRKRRIVFPEGADPRVQEAARRLVAEGLVTPVLIGAKSGLDGVQVIDPARCPDADKYAAILYERRRSKGVTEVEAGQLARTPLYFAALMVAAGHADGAVGGAVNTTAETVRAALTCVGATAGIDTVSGVFFMCTRAKEQGEHGVLAFADCALVVDPSATQVAHIAVAAAGSFSKIVGSEPRVALLSFSTKGSARHPHAEKMERHCGY